MKKLELQKCIVGSVYTNCYFLKNKENDELLIVDPGDAADTIERKVSEMQGKPVGILLTHGHFDHMLAADDLRDEYGIPVIACAAEQQVLTDAMKNLSGSWASAHVLLADQWVCDGKKLDLAGFSIEVFQAPGHTAGSCCYYLPEEEILFSGDPLFAQRVERTDFPTGRGTDMQHSVYRLLKELPETTRVRPGIHGETTICIE